MSNEMRNMLIVNAKVVTPLGNEAVKGFAMRRLDVKENSFIACVDGRIARIGSMDELPVYMKLSPVAFEQYDAEGCVVLPGFVDSHTHLVFGGYRAEEFRWRLEGQSYMDIMRKGGGIQSTVDATRSATAEELAENARWMLAEMRRMGVTTVEAKSGYGLDMDSERRMLDAISLLASDPKTGVRIVSTFLGAHAVPREYKGRTAEYTDLIIREMLPRFRNKATFCDVFCEKEVFELEDSRRLLQAARALGYKLKLHADEIVQLGGAGLAAELKAVSADHLLHVSDADIKRMAEAGVVATLLPLTAFALREPYAPARKFIEAGCAVALATDLNPGSCFSGSIPLTIALACIYMKMSVEEVITAMTLNGAAALDMADITGSLEEGKFADMAVLRFDNYNALPYYVGMNCVKATFKEGFCTYSTN